jgi:2-polyprenyl-3-methyl-5-hydroxy-6-metoxy-1,4-benzoquinol methylase
MDNADFADFIVESKDIWDRNANWWDARMGDGNDWHRMLIAPAVEELLGVQPGERVLELACGNGQFTRRLASLGARVLACDSSTAFLDCARLRTNEYSERIEYHLIDLTSEEQLAALGTGEFDAAVCNMALMDIACITPLLRAARRTLRADGRFVFSVPHPCFNTNGTTLLAERNDYQGNGMVTFSVRVNRYRSLAPQKGIAIVGQPEPHYYFHRTLRTLLGACFAAGMVLDGLEEPAFTTPSADLAPRWDNCGDIPPILAARLRVLGT